MPYTCPSCRRTSHNPYDESNRYCASCKAFEPDAGPTLYLALTGMLESTQHYTDIDPESVGRLVADLTGRLVATDVRWALAVLASAEASAAAAPAPGPRRRGDSLSPGPGRDDH